MACRISELVLKCSEPELLARFWCDVLDFVEHAGVDCVQLHGTEDAAYAAALSGSGTTFGAVLTGPGTLGAVVLIVVQQVYFKITDALSGTKAKKA